MIRAEDPLPTFLTTNDGFAIGVSADFTSLPLDSFPFPERTVIRPEQRDFCISSIRSLILQLVQRSRSPFIHPHSYQQLPPVAYQDLLGICAMYSQKTPQNQAVIFSMLDSRVSSLIYSSKVSTWSKKDRLLAVQALTSYQIIRLFDGDIRQRVLAEKHLDVLESWTIDLISTCNIYNNDTNSDSPYERWVFIESSRRTTLMSVMIQAMYSIAKDGYCTSVPLMANLPISIDGSLWNASEETWWQRTLGLGGNLVTYQHFVHQWNGGDSLFTDTFESILIAACRHNLRRPPLMDV